MTIDEWIYSRLTGSTTITQYTTKVFPDFSSLNVDSPYIVYVNNIGFDRNVTIRQPILSLKGIHNSKSEIASLNDAIYTLFDTSTAYIKETSSNISIDSVSIVNNIEGVYDSENDNWFCVTDVLINYHKI